jgi:hypothetical protein
VRRRTFNMLKQGRKRIKYLMFIRGTVIPTASKRKEKVKHPLYRFLINNASK